MNNFKIAVIDYGIGNVKSICNAIERVGSLPILTNNSTDILEANACILPGVGAFEKGMQNLGRLELQSVIAEFISSGKPFMGICLGMQLLFEESEEFGITAGLGIIKGRVIKMPLPMSSKEKLPHISWNQLVAPHAVSWENTVLEKIGTRNNVYFVHSFVGVPDNAGHVLAYTDYGGCTFCSAVRKENVFGVQFHPEKSGELGLSILKNFVNLSKKIMVV